MHIVLQSGRDAERALVLVKYLIEEHPESVRFPDGQGRLPLHLAVEHGIPCYQILLDAEPTALETPCPVTGLYPFQLAAAGLAMRENHYYPVL